MAFQYRLTFDGERAAQRFEFLYAGLLLGDRLAGADKPTLTQARTLGKVLDAVDSISELSTDAGLASPTGDPMRRLRCAGLSITLDAQQYGLVKRYLELATPHYTARFKRDALDALDWVLAAHCVEDE